MFGVYAIYSLLIFGGIGYLSPLRDLFIITTPFIISLCFLILLWHEKKNINYLKYIGFLVLFTFVIEAVGVYTGLIFGEYEYGKTLGIQVFKTPIIIGLQWGLVVLGIISLINIILPKLNIIIFAFLAGFLAVIFDYVIEPVAMKLDYWDWTSSSGVPIQNYLAWFGITFVLALIFRLYKINLNSPKYPALVLGGFTLFFLILRFFI